MASPRVIAIRRENAELRLRKAMLAFASEYGVKFREPSVLPTRYPDFYAAELIENVAEALEQATGAKTPHQRRTA
jgi:hypothetical protein